MNQVEGVATLENELAIEVLIPCNRGYELSA